MHTNIYSAHMMAVFYANKNSFSESFQLCLDTAKPELDEQTAGGSPQP